jgi:hypothetical protein
MKQPSIMGLLQPVSIIPTAEPLSSFKLFPKLPVEIRSIIWLLVSSPGQRIVHIQERLSALGDMSMVGCWPENESDCDSLDLAVQEFSLSPFIDKALPKKYENDFHIWTDFGQTQLEDFGFTSSKAQPPAPTKRIIASSWLHKWETTRQSGIWSPNPVPVTLHICQESRALLQIYGYSLAFETRTEPALTWFNYSRDILCLSPNFMGDTQVDFELESGLGDRDLKGVVGQLSSLDLERVERIAISLSSLWTWPEYWAFPNRRNPPPSPNFVSPWWRNNIQKFRNLKEFVLMDRNSHTPEHTHEVPWEWEGVYGSAEGTHCDCIEIDVAAEEGFGHYMGWLPRSNPANRFSSGIEVLFRGDHQHATVDYDYFIEKIQRDLEYEDEADLSTDDEKPWDLKGKPPTKEKSSTYPKVRIVNKIYPTSLEEVEESRTRYRQYIQMLYEASLEETQTGLKSSRYRFEFHSDIETLAWYSGYRGEERVDPEWVKKAKDALPLHEDSEILFTDEWVEEVQAQYQAEKERQRRKAAEVALSRFSA